MNILDDELPIKFEEWERIFLNPEACMKIGFLKKKQFSTRKNITAVTCKVVIYLKESEIKIYVILKKQS